jgi:hydrogenase expression/formation protein HypC
MCLAVPMKVVSIDANLAVVESQGIETTVSLDLTPEAALGDFVIVHAGFAIQRLDPEEAKVTLEIFERLEKSWAQNPKE